MSLFKRAIIKLAIKLGFCNICGDFDENIRVCDECGQNYCCYCGGPCYCDNCK